MQMTREGKETAEIRTFIDEKYSQFGPPTETGPVPAGQFGTAGPSQPGAEGQQPGDMTHDDVAGSCGQAVTSCQEISK